MPPLRTARSGVAVIWESMMSDSISALRLGGGRGVAAALLFAAACGPRAVPGEPGPGVPLELDLIVVTATGIGDPLRSLPRAVAVITAEDIAQSPATDTLELLAREANVNLRSLFGHDKTGGIDIRGFGDTAVSNVVILVDGFRLNNADLAAPDLSTVPLGQIERIEIVRGAGSVLYGNGAVGGVVNIITRPVTGATGGSASLMLGSYDMHEERVSASTWLGPLGVRADAGHHDSRGYRDNGYLRSSDLALQLDLDVTETAAAWLRLARYSDRSGLPGPLPAADLYDTQRRRGTTAPNDFSETVDQRLHAGFDVDLAAAGSLQLSAVLRERDNPFIIGYTPLLPKDAQFNRIAEDSRSVDLDYTLDYDLGGREQRLRAGLAHYRSDYLRADPADVVGNQVRHGAVRNDAWFLSHDLSLPGDLRVSAGYRADRFDKTLQIDRYQLVFVPAIGTRLVPGIPARDVWHNDAFEIGLSLPGGGDSVLFAHYAGSFRNPNVDELALSDGDLGPQRGRHLDVGLRGWIGDASSYAVTLFRTRIEDEIYFGRDPVSGLSVNRNYDDATLRRGVELELKTSTLADWTLWANYSYTLAEFESRGTFVPLVPKHLLDIGVEWRPRPALALTLNGRWTGARYDGNDEDNQRFARLPAYQVVDAKLSYRRERLSAFVGIKNLLNELYTTVAYGGSVYPMPERNAYAGVEWRF